MPTPSSLPAKRQFRRPRIGAKASVMGPLSEANFRLQVLDKAGLSPNKLADLLRKSIATLEECAATAMSPLAPTMPDWHARLGAIRQMIALTGANPGKASAQTGEGGQVAVTINMPDWASSSPTKPPVVIDAQPRDIAGEAPNLN